MSTVLVTGAMGQVGKRVVEILLDRGRTVIALDLDTAGTRQVCAALLPGTGTLLPAYADLTDPRAVDALVAEHQPSAIVHLAAVVSPIAYRDPGLARRVNVDGTANLVAAARALPVAPLFLNASSSSVYGSRNPHLHYERLTGATRVRPIDCYGEDKVLAERIVSESGLPMPPCVLAGSSRRTRWRGPARTTTSWFVRFPTTTGSMPSTPATSRWPSPTPLAAPPR